jgi:hypothetical protein
MTYVQLCKALVAFLTEGYAALTDLAMSLLDHRVQACIAHRTT